MAEQEPSEASNVPPPAVQLDDGMYKNRLQEYCQKSGLPLPVYETVNRGVAHLPQFSTTVNVDGLNYSSPKTFNNRKAAEQDIAKFAYFALTKKIKSEAIPLVHEDTMFCKSTLVEFGIKKNLEKPTYTTAQLLGAVPVFSSTVNFNGVNYTGDVAKSKKEAEQLAARAAVISIINTKAGTCMHQIIKSKSKLYNAMNAAKNSITNENDSMLAGTQASSKEKEVEEVNAGTNNNSNNNININNNNNNDIITAVRGQSLGQPTNLPASYPERVEYRNPNPNTNLLMSNEASASTGIVFVSPAADPTLIPGSSGEKKRNKNQRKRAKKKMRLANQVPLDVAPLNQVPPCSVAQ